MERPILICRDALRRMKSGRFSLISGKVFSPLPNRVMFIQVVQCLDQMAARSTKQRRIPLEAKGRSSGVNPKILEEENELRKLKEAFQRRTQDAELAKAQAKRIAAMLNDTSFAPPSDSSSSEEDEEDALSNADALVRLQQNTKDDQDVAEVILKKKSLGILPTARKKSRKKNFEGTNVSVVYGDYEDVIDDDTREAHETELIEDLRNLDDTRDIAAMVRKYQFKIRPAPPDFSSTSLATEMEQLTLEVDQIVEASDNLLRILMDPSGRRWKPTSLDGEIARIAYHAGVCTGWSPAVVAHAQQYEHGVKVIMDGATAETGYVRRDMLDIKEDTENLDRVCSRRQLELDAATKKAESLRASSAARQLAIEQTCLARKVFLPDPKYLNVSDTKTELDRQDREVVAFRLRQLLNSTHSTLTASVPGTPSNEDDRQGIVAIERLLQSL